MSTTKMSIETIGAKLRKLREENKLPLRKVAALLDMDTAILSKMERGQRPLTKEVVKKLAKIYKHDADELHVLYLSERVMKEIGNDNMASRVLIAAEAQVAYGLLKTENKNSILLSIKNFFKEDKRVKEAWLFGSFARGDSHYNSDIDLMVSFDRKKKISLFDMADIAFKLKQQTKRKIDLVEEGCLEPFALASAKKDLQKIYG